MYDSKSVCHDYSVIFTDLDMCSHVGPCVEGNCTNTGPESYMCQCSEGFSGANCTDADKDTIPGMHICVVLVAL